MTRTTTSNTVSAIGIGAIATIPYTFPITADTDLVGVQRDLDGAETPLTLATDYTVTGAGTLAGGNIVSVAAIPLGYKWTFKRVRSITQTTDLRNQGAYYPEVIEDALDKLTDIAQQHEEEIGRCLIAATTDTLSSYELPSLKDKEGYALGVISGPALGLVANSALELAADLADVDTPALGAGMVGYASTTSYPAGSVGAAIQASASASTPTYAEVQNQTYVAFASGGTAPAFTLTPSPALTALADGQELEVAFGADGTTGSNTLNVSALGAKALKQYDSSGSLVSGVVKNGFIARVRYNGTYWIILNPLPSATATAGRLLGVSYYAAGTSAYVKGTNNPTFIVVEGCGAGGSGIGGASTPGGYSGGYFRKKILASALAASETVTVGAGGAAVKNTNGNAGGTTSFGSHVSATGGSGGGVYTPGTATGGDLNCAGMRTSTSVGAPSYFGGGGAGSSGNADAGGAPGAGGGACTTTASYSGAGADGIVIVYEYS